MSAPTQQVKTECLEDHADVQAVQDAASQANLIFIIALVVGILCGVSAGISMWRGMGLPMTIAAAILGLVGSIVSGVFFFQKKDLDACLEPIPA